MKFLSMFNLNYTKKAYVFMFLFFITNLLFAQKFKNVIGPSPEAAAFSKYTDIPVSNYTGIPNIDIPIFSIKGNDVTVPVSLSYHAGGIRVDEEASRAGLGWVLNAGGLISRNVNGIDDFEYATGYTNNSIPEYFDDQVTQVLQLSTSNILVANEPDEPNEVVVFNIAGHPVDLTGYLPTPGSAESTWFDTEPDVFSYNFNGYNGKFSIKKNKTVVKQTPDALDIKLLNNDGTSWQITTPDGIRYIFDKIEKTRFQSSAGSFSEYITSWYLTKIISSNDNEIGFSYQETGDFTVRSFNNLDEKYIFNVHPLNAAASLGFKPTVGTKTTNYPALKSYNQILLNSITFPTGSVDFEYDTRIDLAGDNRLSKIYLKDRSEVVQTYFELIHDYFTANSGGNTIPDPEINMNQDFFNKRLKLYSLLRKNAAGIVEQNYSFNYEEENLPSKKSFARDHWGYYNGKTFNSSFLPNKTFNNPYIVGQTFSYSPGGDRSPSSTHPKAFLLKKITYPSGGTTSFVYESNDYDIANSINNYSAVTSGNLITETKSFSARRGVDNTVSFQVPAGIISQNFTFKTMSQNGQATSWPYPYSDDAFMEIYSAQDLSTPLYRVLWGLESFFVNQGNYNYTRDDLFTLPPGNYILKTHVASNVTFLNYMDISFSCNYYLDNTTNHNIEMGGGVRINKIANYDPVSNKTTTKNFNYHYYHDYDEDGIAEKCSYGRKMVSERYTSNDIIQICNTNAGDAFTQGVSIVYNLLSQSYLPSGDVTVGYDKVTISDDQDGLNGYSEFYYKNFPNLQIIYNVMDFDSFGATDFRPSGVPSLKSLDNGLLIKEIDYKRNTGSGEYNKIKEVINTYEKLPTITQVGVRITNTMISCHGGPGEGLLYAQYPAFQSSWSRLSSQAVNDYSNDINFVSSITDYQYETGSPKHYLPLITTVINSTGRKTVNVKLYPTDYADGNTTIDELKIANIIAPIEQVTAIKTGNDIKITSGKITLFKEDGKNLIDKEFFLETLDPIPLSSYKFSNQVTGTFPSLTQGGIFASDTKYKLSLSYDRYDSRGNILQITPTNGLSTSYLWSYNKEYPIAEIKNVAYSNIETILGATIIQDFSDEINPDKIAIDNLINPLRISLPDVHFTTFSYNPLVGMRSSTDVKGMTTYYEYDSFQRLRYIKDHDGNIVKEYTYHYKP